MAVTAFLLEGHADACSAPAPPEGYIVSLATSAMILDDTATRQACQLPVGSCGGLARHEGVKKQLVVAAVVKTNSGTSAEEVKIDRFDQLDYVLKNSAGVEIARSRGAGVFSELGATVCAQVRFDEVDSGGSDRRSEICTPVTVTSLDITAEDRSEHNARVAKECERFVKDAGAASDSGTLPVDAGSNQAQPAGSDGCTMGSSSSSLWLGGLMAYFFARRRRSTRA